MDESQAEVSDEATTSAVPDVGSLNLEELLSDNDSALDHAVRRVVDQMQERSEQYAAHSSSS